MRSVPFVTDLAVVGILATLYFAAGKLGLEFAYVHPSSTAVWPPTGISLAALIILGYRVWPGIFLGAFVVSVTTAGGVAASLGMALGNTLEGLTGAYFVNRFAGGRSAFDRAGGVFKYALFAALLGTSLSATVGVAGLALGGHAASEPIESIWLTWWLGDAAGALLVAPVLVLWIKQPRPGWSPEQTLELGLLLMSLILVAWTVFGGLLALEDKNYPLSFLCIPLLVWPAFRFGQRETVTATLLLSGMAIWGTLRGFGPFVRATPNESLLLLQTYVGVIAVMAMALAATVVERRQAERRMKESFREKEVLGKEIHHRVKNNLQVISSLLSLQAPYIKDKEALEIFRESQNRIRSIALVHEALRQSGNLSRIDMGVYVRNLAGHLFGSYGSPSDRIALKIHVADVWLGVDAAISCGLLIQELLSNALRHAFPPGGKGEIRVELRRQPRSAMTLIVADDGVGLPGGLDFSKARTLGLQLVHIMTEQLGGVLEYEGPPGTAFRMTFSEAKQEGRSSGNGNSPYLGR